MIAFGQGDPFGNALLYLFDHASQVGTLDIPRNDQFTADVFAVNGVGSRRGDQLGHIAQRHLHCLAGRIASVEQNPGNTLHRRTAHGVELQRNVKGAFALIDLRNHAPGQGGFDRLRKLCRRDTPLAQQHASRLDLQLGAFDLLFDHHIHKAGHIGRSRFDAVAQGKKLVQVIPEDLDGNVGAGPRQQQVDTVRDGLPDFKDNTLNVTQPLTHIGKNLGTAPLLQHKRHINLRSFRPQGMLVEFGPSRFAGHHGHLGHLHQLFFDQLPQTNTLLERNAGHGRDMNGHRPFVKGRQEVAAQGAEHRHGTDKQCGCHAHHHFPMVQHRPQHTPVEGLHFTHHPRFAFVAAQHPFARQQVAAQDRGQGNGHHHRGKERDDKGDTERLQHPSLHAAQEEERNEGHDDNQRGIPDGGPYLGRGLVDHFQDRSSFVRREMMVFAQPFEDVFNVDNGIIDQRPDGNGHPPEAHCVEGEAQGLQHQQRHQQRQRNGQQRNECRADVAQENHQNHHHQHSTLDQCPFDVADGAFDKGGLAEDFGCHLHVGRQGAHQVGQRAVELFGQFEGPGRGLFGYREAHRPNPIDRRITHHGSFTACTHLGHIGQRNGRSGCRVFYDTGSHLFGRGGAHPTADNVLVAILVQDTSRRIGIHGLGGRQQFVEAHAVVAHQLRRSNNLVFMDISADHRDLRDASRREESRPQGPVCQRAELFERGAVGRQADHQHLAQQRRLRSQHRSLRPVGQPFGDTGQFFRNNLSCDIDVRSPVELHRDGRKSGCGGGADSTYIRCPVQGCLNGEGHQPFDLFGRHPRRFGHHHHRRRGEVREDIDLHTGCRVSPRQQQQNRHQQHTQTVVERELNYLVNHAYLGFIEGSALRVSENGRGE